MIEHHPVDALEIADLRSELMDVLAENQGRNRGFIVSADVVAALLDIVEALAASDPTGEDWQGGCTCPHCDEYRCDPRDPKPHGPNCPYGAALALVGQAGEREEGES